MVAVGKVRKKRKRESMVTVGKVRKKRKWESMVTVGKVRSRTVVLIIGTVYQ
jgi:hypothetical protein